MRSKWLGTVGKRKQHQYDENTTFEKKMKNWNFYLSLSAYSSVVDLSNVNCDRFFRESEWQKWATKSSISRALDGTLSMSMSCYSSTIAIINNNSGRRRRTRTRRRTRRRRRTRTRTSTGTCTSTIRCDAIHYLCASKSWRTAILICRTEPNKNE